MALLSGGTFWFAVPPEDALSDLPVVRVNADDRLMAVSYTHLTLPTKA